MTPFEMGVLAGEKLIGTANSIASLGENFEKLELIYINTPIAVLDLKWRKQCSNVSVKNVVKNLNVKNLMVSCVMIAWKMLNMKIVNTKNEY